MGDYNTSQQPQSRWGSLWDALMGKKALQRAAGQAPVALAPNQDTAIVSRAAEDAGRRMEDEKRKKRGELISTGMGNK